MPCTKEQRRETVAASRRHEKDSGSPEVQIALLTAQLENLSRHLEGHRKDKHSARGLILMVSRRNRLLRYLRTRDYDRYKALLEKLNLRK